MATKRAAKKKGMSAEKKVGIALLILMIGIITLCTALGLSKIYNWNSERMDTEWVGRAQDEIDAAIYSNDSWDMIPHLSSAEVTLSSHGENTWYLQWFIDEAFETSDLLSDVQYRRELDSLKNGLREYPMPDRNTEHGKAQGRNGFFLLLAAAAAFLLTYIGYSAANNPYGM